MTKTDPWADERARYAKYLAWIDLAGRYPELDQSFADVYRLLTDADALLAVKEVANAICGCVICYREGVCGEHDQALDNALAALPEYLRLSSSD